MYTSSVNPESVLTVVKLGASFTGVTLIVMVFALLVSAPPLAVPPLSCTLKLKLAYLLPLALIAGVNLKLPISVAAIRWSTTTAVKLSLTSFKASTPEEGVLLMITASKT